MRKNSFMNSTAVFAAADSAKGPGTNMSPGPAADGIAEGTSGDEQANETQGEPNRQIIAITDETKVAAISKALTASRKLYNTFGEAYAAATKASGETEEFYGLPVAVVGYDAETGVVDESIYDGAKAALAYVGARIDDPTAKQKKISGIKAVVIFPIFTLESIMAGGEAALAWVEKLIEKESAHVAFRNFRDVATTHELQTNTGKAPTTVDAYVTASNREGNGLDTDTFDALWAGLRNSIKAEQPVLYKLLPAKPEVIKAIRSKSYAESETALAPLEAKGIFVRLGQILIAGATAYKNKDGTANPLPTEAIASWLEGRDTLEISKREVETKDFSLLESLDF